MHAIQVLVKDPCDGGWRPAPMVVKIHNHADCVHSQDNLNAAKHTVSDHVVQSLGSAYLCGWWEHILVYSKHNGMHDWVQRQGCIPDRRCCHSTACILHTTSQQICYVNKKMLTESTCYRTPKACSTGHKDGACCTWLLPWAWQTPFNSCSSTRLMCMVCHTSVDTLHLSYSLLITCYT